MRCKTASGDQRLSMPILIIVEEPDDWPLEIPDVTIVSARTYLTDPGFAVNHGAGQTRHSLNRSARVFNLCKSYHYQSSGYYVSLLAEARGHKPLPKVGAIEDLQSQNLVRHLTEDLSALIQRLLAPLQWTISNSLSISAEHIVAITVLGHQLFNLLQARSLSAHFERHRDQWSLRSVRAMTQAIYSPAHQEFAVLAAIEYFKVKGPGRSKKHISRFDLAILHDPDNPEPPSNAKAMQKFKNAAEELGMRVKFITRADIAGCPNSMRCSSATQPLSITILITSRGWHCRKAGGDRRSRIHPQVQQ